jgi:AcrR family transcriptional regulator
MHDVAKEACLARQTLYKFVSSREELVELVLAARSTELIPEFVRRRERLWDRPLTDLLVEFLAQVVEVTRDDAEFAMLAGAMKRDQAFAFLAGDSPLRPLVREVLDPVFERAAAEEMLRDVPRYELAGLAQLVMTPLAAQLDLDAAGIRRILSRLALPALLKV